jgi:hypothetical protein
MEEPEMQQSGKFETQVQIANNRPTFKNPLLTDRAPNYGALLFCFCRSMPFHTQTSHIHTRPLLNLKTLLLFESKLYPTKLSR